MIFAACLLNKNIKTINAVDQDLKNAGTQIAYSRKANLIASSAYHLF